MITAQIKSIIKKITVNIKVSVDGKSENGTGVLIQQGTQSYVVTVHHCIYGKNEPYHNTQVDNIKLIFDNNTFTDDIKIKQIIPFEKNIVLLEIENLGLNDIELQCLDRVYEDKTYYLRGFPSALNGKSHNFQAMCNDTDINTIGFSIILENLTDETSGIGANEYMGGLSGSGVFFSENNQLYLVGLVNALGNSTGVFNRVDCIKLIDLHYSDIEISTLHTIDDVTERIRKIKEEISMEAYDKYQEKNIELYTNLDRKHQNIYDKRDVEKKNYNAIKKYLIGRASVSELKLVDSSFEKKLFTFIDDTLEVIEDYTNTSIDEKREGRENLMEIRTKVVDMIKNDFEIIKKETNISELVKEYVVVGWLLNCNVDYILED